MICEKCGTVNPDNARFCVGCGHSFVDGAERPKGEKNMALALIISFILPGLGIVYAGNARRGIILFLFGVVFAVLGISAPICALISILIWAYALYQTYNETRIANGHESPNLLEDWKGWSNPKKAAAAAVVIIVILAVIGGVGNAFLPHANTSGSHPSSGNANISSLGSSHSSSGSGSSYSDISPASSGSEASSSGDDSYLSSSSNGHDVSSHYEGEHGSSDTYGTVYDDGSVESHQTGHTEYGEYQVDSYMDSDGNVHGTVDVGGRTYEVSY